MGLRYRLKVIESVTTSGRWTRQPISRATAATARRSLYTEAQRADRGSRTDAPLRARPGRPAGARLRQPPVPPHSPELSPADEGRPYDRGSRRGGAGRRRARGRGGAVSVDGVAARWTTSPKANRHLDRTIHSPTAPPSVVPGGMHRRPIAAVFRTRATKPQFRRRSVIMKGDGGVPGVIDRRRSSG